MDIVQFFVLGGVSMLVT